LFKWDQYKNSRVECQTVDNEVRQIEVHDEGRERKADG
jgi:hypothetical protein